MSLFSLYFLNKTFAVIWYSKPLISSNKSLNKYSILGLLAISWTDKSFESIISML